MKAVIFDVKRFAIHDGPGIRTTVFFKGCPLRCAWCHNPESQGFGVETRAGRGGSVTVGREASVEEVMAEIARDVPFFDESGGGVTFSGGEPLSQPEFLVEVLDRCGAMDIHCAVDTCGYAPQDVLLRVAERTHLFLFDLKLADSARHRARTGVATERIHDNLRALCRAGAAIELRVPVVPSLTGTEENLAALKALIGSLPRRLPVRLLPYHRAAMDKYPRFGMERPLPDVQEPTEEDMRNAERWIRNDAADGGG